MKFTKMHGLGNDYVYVSTFTERVVDPVSLSRAVSDRFTGIGSDGLILIAPSDQADVRMEMYNADGSRGKMCGNGIRCVAKYAVEHGLAAGPQLRIETDAGVKTVWCEMSEPRTSSPRGSAAARFVTAVRVNMGPPILEPQRIPVCVPGDTVVNRPLVIAGQLFQVTCVSMGNPHAVVFVNDLAEIDLQDIGPDFETAEYFPEQINAHFAKVESPSRITAKTWERGSGATRACGTGACAVAVAGVLTGRSERRVTMALPGGELRIEWAGDNNVYMTGPAVEVFTGIWPE